MNAEAAINMGALVPWLAVLSALAALVAWQFKADPEKSRTWLGMSAISLELLAAGLAVNWAINNADGAFKVLFIGGVIGLSVAKATLLPNIVAAYRRRLFGAMTLGLVGAMGAYTTIYGLGSMSGLDTDSAKAAQAVAQSAPLKAIDAEILVTRERLQALAGFADAGKAHAETQAIASADQSKAARSAELENAIATTLSDEPKNREGLPAGRSLDSLTAGCTNTASFYAKYCAQVEAYRRELVQIQHGGAGAGSGYAAQHDEYNGVQQHLTALEHRRAEMLTGDSTAVAGMAVGASDRMIGWLFGLSEERARAMKWLLLVMVFDVISGVIRLFSEMMHGTDKESVSMRRKLAALLDAGVDPVAAAGMLGGHSPAGVLRPHEIPALDTGGLIIRDGLAQLHAGERVLNARETEHYHAWLASQQGHSAGGHVPAGTRWTAEMSQQGHADTTRQPPARAASDVGQQCKYSKILEALQSAKISPEYAARFAEIAAMSVVDKRKQTRLVIKELLGENEGCETKMLDQIIKEVF